MIELALEELSLVFGTTLAVAIFVLALFAWAISFRATLPITIPALMLITYVLVTYYHLPTWMLSIWGLVTGVVVGTWIYNLLR